MGLPDISKLMEGVEDAQDSQKKQTKLLERQTIALERIADALEGKIKKEK